MLTRPRFAAFAARIAWICVISIVAAVHLGVGLSVQDNALIIALMPVTAYLPLIIAVFILSRGAAGNFFAVSLALLAAVTAGPGAQTLRLRVLGAQSLRRVAGRCLCGGRRGRVRGRRGSRLCFSAQNFSRRRHIAQQKPLSSVRHSAARHAVALSDFERGRRDRHNLTSRGGRVRICRHCRIHSRHAQQLRVADRARKYPPSDSARTRRV